MELLEEAELHLKAVDEFVAKMKAMFAAEADPILRIPIIGIAADWVRVRVEHNHRLLASSRSPSTTK